MNLQKTPSFLIRPIEIEEQDYKFFFLHIPKTGGTTIDNIVQQYSKISNSIKYIRLKNEYNVSTFKKNVLKKNKIFISGHLNESTFDEQDIEGIKKITIIRNPFNREISHYKFKAFKNNFSIENYKLENFLMSQYEKFQDNITVRLLSNIAHSNIRVSNIHLELAKKNLKNFWLYCSFDQWDLFTKILISYIGMPNIVYIKMQKYNYKFSYQINDNDRSLIEQYSKFDINLYNEVFKDENFFHKKKLFLNKIKLINEYLYVSHKNDASKNRIFSNEEIQKIFGYIQ